jgi:hypothetical protein
MLETGEFLVRRGLHRCEPARVPALDLLVPESRQPPVTEYDQEDVEDASRSLGPRRRERPWTTGQVLAQLRQQAVGIPVIAISGLATAATAFLARLEKPFSFSNLAATVADAVAQARSGA